MRHGFEPLTLLGGLLSVSIGSLAGCVADAPAIDLPASRTDPPRHAGGFEFVAHLDPSTKRFEIEPVIDTSLRGLKPALVVQDGTIASGPPNSLELVTTDVTTDVLGDSGCGITSSFCAKVSIRSFYGGLLRDVYAEIDQVTPAASHPALNGTLAVQNLSDVYGLWSYGIIQGNGEAVSREWVFGDDGTGFTIHGRVMADLCGDGAQDGDETDVDCGGSECPACAPCGESPSSQNQSGNDCGPPKPFPDSFRFAGTSGIGMGTACACQAVSSEDGTHLQFRRSTRAYCLKTDPAGLIAAGDLVSCPPDAPRVMAGDDSGQLGLLVETPGVSSFQLAPSNDLSDSAWNKFGVGVEAPSVTTNACVAPDGTMTAARVRFAATAAGQFSALFAATNASPESHSVWLRSFTAADQPSTDFCHHDGTAWVCSHPAAPAAGWRWFKQENLPSHGYWLLGNASDRNGGVAHSAVDVCVWWPQAELGGQATTPIPIGGRGGENAYFPLRQCDPQAPGAGVSSAPDILGCPNEGAVPGIGYSVYAPRGHNVKMEAKVVGVTDWTLNQTILELGESTVDCSQRMFTSAGAGAFQGDWQFHGPSRTLSAPIRPGPSSSFRMSYDGSQRFVCVDGQCNAVPGRVKTCTANANALSIGGQGYAFDGVSPAGFGAPGFAAVNGVIKSVAVSATQDAQALWISDWPISAATAGGGATSDGASFSHLQQRIVHPFTSSILEAPTLADCRAIYDAKTRPYIDRVVLTCGLGDILSDRSGAAVAADLTELVLVMESDGKTVILGNFTPFERSGRFTTARNEQRLAANAAIAQFCAGHPATKCFDAARAVWDESDHDALSPSLGSPDNVTLGPAGDWDVAIAANAAAP